MTEGDGNSTPTLIPGDVNEELARFLEGGPDVEYHEYAFALLSSRPFQTNEERLICAAEQLQLCTFSSGLFSYFEIQSELASSGIEAFNELDLPEFANLVRRALELLALDDQASTSDIERASHELVRVGLEKFLDEVEPLDLYVEENAPVLSRAISEYIRKNSAKLWRTP